VDEVGLFNSEFCSKNYLVPICYEVSDVLLKFRTWNRRDLQGTKECPGEWDYFDHKDRQRLKGGTKQLSKAIDEFVHPQFKAVVCTKDGGAFSCLNSKGGSPFEQKYRFTFCLKSVPELRVAYDEDEDGDVTKLEKGDKLMAVSAYAHTARRDIPKKAWVSEFGDIFPRRR
jgi:hypothetical protein